MNNNENTPSVEDEAYHQSLALLHRCLTPAGFVASPVDVDNYARIWARDGIIAGLAALTSGDAALIQGMEHTLDTLATYQGPHGEVPSNVSVDGSKVSYGRLTGRVDALLWYIIGVCAYLDRTKHASQKVRYWLSVERALFLAACWEYNNRGLIYTPISGNWADEYIQQGYVLSDQLLYELALRSAGLVFKNKDCLAKADMLRQSIEVNYWPQASLLDNSLIYHPHAYAHQVEQQQTIQHWLLSFSPAGYVTYFDGLAHALALITNIGSEAQQQQAEAYVQGLEQQIGSTLIPAFWPVIQPDNSDWAALQTNHLYEQIKNSPYHYHNGGLWSMVTGFYAVGLAQQNKRERARHLLTAINAANAQGRAGRQWEFAEYHHGQTHEPLGTPDLAWSAAAGILAHQALVEGHVPWPL